MNKAVVLFLISVFMCANTSIGQLLKIPNLIEHYIEHKNEVANSSSSFIDFIKEHYSKNADSNNDEHQNLPFKTIEHNTNVFVAFNILNYQLIPNKVFFTTNKTFIYKSTFKSNFCISIWLPPKLA